MSTRPDADRCPGVLRTYPAADGALVRVRVPGGRLEAARLRRVLAAAAECGVPFVQLTSRANLQFRGLSDPVPQHFLDAITDAGMLPHPTHERVRTIVASPWSVHERELGEFVAELDARLCADPGLAALPGRFLVVVDDGTGDLLDLPYDVGYQRVDASAGRLLVAGRSVEVGREKAVGLLLDRAREFLRYRQGLDPAPWSIREVAPDAPVFAGLSPLPAASSAECTGAGAECTAPGAAQADSAAHRPAGARGADLVLTVPLGLLGREQVEVLAQVSPALVLTPWRQVVLPGAARRAEPASQLARLESVGLVSRPGSGWDGVTACIGAPYCRRTSVDTHRIAREIATATALPRAVRYPSDPVVSPGVGVPSSSARVHVSGCERRCGAPTGPYQDVLAPGDVQEALEMLGGSAGATPH
ncbi:MAG: hypothetical protein ACK5MT_17845 [Actinomycetales bacterium]